MLDKQFDPIATQEAARRYWKPTDFSPQGTGKPYCIMLPPPNVTGTLHMGHGFQHTLMDALIRYHRMCGDKTLWQPGTDHAGIATQIVVEKQLIQQGLDRKTLGRDAFEARVWEWKAQSGGTIVEQMKKLGTTADWSRERFTMDADLSKAVTYAFVKLYNDGLIYRGRRLVNWDPVLQSALSDLEVLSEETQGSLWHLRYPLVEGKEFLVVATTRPETLLGDVAVAVHPEDERYKHLIGRQLRLPLTDRTIRIIADEYVDPSFGSGCVKITPAHDFNDFEVSKRHSLSNINIFTPDAKLNDEVPAAYRGLTREAARKKVLEDLTQANLIEKIDAHTLQVPKSERSGAVVEPYLTEQWYVKMDALGKAALEVVEKGEIEFFPEQWVNTYRQWLVNIQDWCVSRQLWWGHRIPAWYDDDGKIYVAETREAAQQQAGDKRLHQDDDVLDTWFSSALWPFSTLGWPEKTPELETFYPTSVLVTGFDIIFFWVARMIMFGLYFTKKIPFKQVVFTGLIRDHDGQKMSKSKGNVIDPIDLITGISLEALVAKRTSGMMLPSQAQAVEKATRKQFPEGIPAFGEDALRVTFCALATQGRDVRFDLARMEGNRNFCNKIWNATRFIQMQLEKCEVTQVAQGFPEFSACDLPEQWLLEKLNQVIISARHYFETYRFDLLAQLLYEFTWYEFCDWYIEFAKIRLQQNPVQPLILQVLINALEVILRLLHPLMPFITEDIWQQALKPILNLSGESLLLAPYPERTVIPENQAASWIEKSKSIILGVRQVRAFYRIEPKKILPLAYVQDPVDDLTPLVTHPSLKLLIEQLAKLETLKVATNDQVFEGEYGRSSVMESLVVIVPLTGLVDLEAEKAKVKKEKEKLTVELLTLKERLANPKAPEAVLDKWRARLTEIEAALEMMG